MCLSISHRRKAPRSPLTVYKVYVRSMGGMRSILRPSYPGGHFNFRKNRVLCSSRASAKRGSYERDSIDYGFHVYTCKRDAIAVARNKGRVVVELEGAPEDFVAFGLNHDNRPGAVFTKLKLKRIIK